MFYFVLICLFLVILCINIFFLKKKRGNLYDVLLSTLDINNYINKSKNKITELINLIERSSPISKRPFTNIGKINESDKRIFIHFDQICFIVSKVLTRLELATLVLPDPIVREEAQKTIVDFTKWKENLLLTNASLYIKLKTTYDRERDNFNEVEKKLAEDILLDYKLSGAEVKNELKQKVLELKENITKKYVEFAGNIYAHNEKVLLTEEETRGLNKIFKESLHKNNDGLYVLGLDYPTYNTAIQYLESKSARKKLYYAFYSIGYPANHYVLQDLRIYRHEYAKLLGFNNFPELDFKKKMAKSYQNVENFCHTLIESTKEYAEKEKNLLISTKPENINLNSEHNCFDPEDVAYVIRYVKEKKYNIDQKEIQNYFPLDHVLDSSLSIYSNFFNIIFNRTFEKIWIENLYVVKAYDHNKNYIGSIILDLFPRKGKYNHACSNTITHNIKNFYQEDCINIIVCNFTKATTEIPSLLTFVEVETLFHELGHAIHALLGKTTFFHHSGTNVYTDFVEVPSQLFEQWLEDKAVLKKISCHYKTKESLPDNLIEKLIRSSKFCRALFLQKIMAKSLFALYIFDEKNRDIEAIKNEIQKKIISPTYLIDEDHFECSFGHLTEYGASYYSYMWSLVYSLMLFNYIKEHGLENSTVGTKFAETILSKSGEDEPLKLMGHFLKKDLSNIDFTSTCSKLFKDYVN